MTKPLKNPNLIKDTKQSQHHNTNLSDSVVGACVINEGIVLALPGSCCRAVLVLYLLGRGHCLFLFPSPHLHRLVWMWLTKPPPTSRGTISLPSTLLISLPFNWYTEEIPLTKASIFQSCR